MNSCTAVPPEGSPETALCTLYIFVCVACIGIGLYICLYLCELYGGIFVCIMCTFVPKCVHCAYLCALHVFVRIVCVSIYICVYISVYCAHLCVLCIFVCIVCICVYCAHLCVLYVFVCIVYICVY